MLESLLHKNSSRRGVAHKIQYCPIALTIKFSATGRAQPQNFRAQGGRKTNNEVVALFAHILHYPSTHLPNAHHEKASNTRMNSYYTITCMEQFILDPVVVLAVSLLPKPQSVVFSGMSQIYSHIVNSSCHFPLLFWVADHRPATEPTLL